MRDSRYKINKATEGHIGYISEVMRARWNLTKREAAEQSGKYLAQDGKHAGWVLVFEGKSVGVGLFDHENSDVSGKYGPWLPLLWIEPAHRGHGLGVKLTEARMAHARRYGYGWLYIDTVNSLAYHLKLGWEMVEQVDYHGKQDSILSYNLSERFPKPKTSDSKQARMAGT